MTPRALEPGRSHVSPCAMSAAASRLGLARARLLQGDTRAAQRATLGGPRLDLERAKWVDREAGGYRGCRPVDDDRRREGRRSRGTHGIRGLQERCPCGEDVVYEHDALVRGDGPTAAQGTSEAAASRIRVSRFREDPAHLPAEQL